MSKESSGMSQMKNKPLYHLNYFEIDIPSKLSNIGGIRIISFILNIQISYSFCFFKISKTTCKYMREGLALASCRTFSIILCIDLVVSISA